MHRWKETSMASLPDIPDNKVCQSWTIASKRLSQQCQWGYWVDLETCPFLSHAVFGKRLAIQCVFVNGLPASRTLLLLNCASPNLPVGLKRSKPKLFFPKTRFWLCPPFHFSSYNHTAHAEIILRFYTQKSEVSCEDFSWMNLEGVLVKKDFIENCFMPRRSSSLILY